MKKQIASVKAHLIRDASYVLLLLAVCVIPFALAQRRADKQSTAANTKQLVFTSSDSPRDTRALPMSEFPTGGVLWDQYNNPATEPPINVGSQDFEPAMAAFDDQAADDFVLATPPPGINVYITGVRVLGEYSPGGGPASSFNVYFYSNGAGNLPGTLIGAYLNLPYTGSPPDFTIDLPHPVPFSPGTLWVSVQARQDFNPNGQWSWHNRTVQSGNAGAAWQNPGNGYGTGCTAWNRKNACLPDQVWPDQVFQILGFLEGNPPTPTPSATFTPTSTPTATPTSSQCANYVTTTGTGTIVPGTTDIGNHCDDCTTTISLPFPVSVYGTSYTSVVVSSNGNLQFTSNSTYAGSTCLLPSSSLGTAILPYQDDLRTDNAGTPDCVNFASGCGVFTSVVGTAPNRQFNVEWRTGYLGRAGTANFEARFYENTQSSFDIFYGITVDNGFSEVSGVQQSGSGPATTFSCNASTLTNGLKVTYTCSGTPCGTNKIYNIAGSGTLGFTNTTRIYDIPNNAWTTGAPLPTRLSDIATAYWNGKIYVAAGYNGIAVNTLYIYDVVSNTWTNGPNMPQAVFLPAFGIINGKLYIASGNTGVSEVNTLQVYDIASNTWTVGAPIPTPVTGPGSGVYQEKLYVFGGGAPYPTTTAMTQVYDPVANTWTICGNMNVARLWFYGGNIDNTSIVAPGGDTSPGTPSNVNEQGACGWAVRAALPYPARGPFAVSDGTYVYIGGGYDGSTIHTDTLRYDPVANTYTPLAPAPDPHYLSQAVLVSVLCGTPTPTPTATFTPTPTARPTPTPRQNPTPRARPTPPPRP